VNILVTDVSEQPIVSVFNHDAREASKLTLVQLLEQNAVSLDVKVGGACSYHRTVKVAVAVTCRLKY
jgi:hypothetical protein